MPIFGLPKVVESAMNALLETSHVSSWKLTGGEKYSVITVRFNMEGGPHGMCGTQTYRKKAPSQVLRDTKRQQDRMKNVSMEVTQDSYSKNDGLNIDTGEVTHLKSLPLKSPETNICEIDNESGTSAEPDQSLEHCTQNKPGVAIVDISHENDTTVAMEASLPVDYKSSSLPDDTESISSQENESVFNDDDFKCNICDKVLLSSWRRCTACNIFNICDTCYIRNEHSHHQTQIHHFKQPNDLANHCDSCGYEFVTRNAKYYRCNSCQDYVLCVKCKTEKMHERHSYQFEDKTMKK